MKILSYFAFMNFVLLLIYIIYGFENIKKSKLAIPFIMLFTSLALWCLGSTFFYIEQDKIRAIFWYEFSSLGWITFPAFTLHFFLLLSKFLEREEYTKTIHKTRILLMIYLIPCVFLIKELIFKKHILYTGITKSTLGLGWTAVNSFANAWSWLYILYLCIYFILGFYVIKKWGQFSKYNSEKQHSDTMLFVCLVTFMFGISTDIISPFFDDFLPPIANLFLIIIIISSFFIIQKYRPFDDPGKIKAKIVLNSINDPVIFFDSEYKLIKINKAVTTVLGYSLKELQLQELIYILADHTYNKQNISYLLENKYIRNKEINLLTADGRILNTIYSASIVENEYHEFLGYIITFKDVTDKKIIEKQVIESNKKYKKLLKELSYAAKCDQLTGLLNRGSFYREMKRLVYDYHNFQYDFTIIFADLNGFKAVNDRYGHDLGDEVLVESANRLIRCMHEQGVVFRMGGDEFIMVLKTSSKVVIMEKINAIRESFSDKIKIQELEIEVGISLGYAVFSESNEDLDKMINKADALMYTDKMRYQKSKYNSIDKGE